MVTLCNTKSKIRNFHNLPTENTWTFCLYQQTANSAPYNIKCLVFLITAKYELGLKT